ncbi:MAG: hypothetical protein M5U34_32000 [Chloroflexi bacterium]|nr:hypothetical protein [Chloroflexota bacterium]
MMNGWGCFCSGWWGAKRPLLFPPLAGVGYSQNPYRWNPRIRREDGFLRLVWGLGTRAVDRVDQDYPRMISLSHPQLRPETSITAVRQHAQWYVDVVDLQANAFVSLPVAQVLQADYPLFTPYRFPG